MEGENKTKDVLGASAADNLEVGEVALLIEPLKELLAVGLLAPIRTCTHFARSSKRSSVFHVNSGVSSVCA